MNDDWNGFVGVIILWTLYFLLLNYFKLMAIAQQDWANLKCNPLYMLISSINQDEGKATNNFKQCVNNM